MAGSGEHDFAVEIVSSGRAETRIFPPGHRLVVSTDNPEDLALAERAIRALGRFAAASRTMKQAERVERLVEALIEDEPLTAIDRTIADDNAQLRARYLQTVPTFSAADLHAASGSAAANRSALASGWKKERRVFAVSHRGIDRYPTFQFRDGQPLRAVRRVLEALPDGMSPWQIAFWFASGNGWLGGDAPQDRLSDEQQVIAAAEHMRERTLG